VNLPSSAFLALLDDLVDRALADEAGEAEVAGAIADAGFSESDDGEARLVLCKLAFDDARLREVEPRSALVAVLRLLDGIAGVSDGSIWAPATPTGMHCLAHIGADPTRRVKVAARSAFRAGEAVESSPSAAIVGLPIRRFGDAAGALVVRVAGAGRTIGLDAAGCAARSLGSLLERVAMLEANAERDRLIVESANRKLARLTLDMHDGPVQDVIALLSDVRLYKGQLTKHLNGVPNAELLVGRVDDFEARLVAVDDELRQFALSFESPSVLELPFEDAIQSEVVRTRSAGVEVLVDVTLEDAEALTPSQRIALLRIVQEGLSNVRDHSGASSVTVAVVDHGAHTTLRVTDDGAGFDVERTLVRAARSGRLGLVGMAERVRLLGGVFDIDSAPGSGTTISVTLPRWSPR
jgi:signal transduction histidine kinase